MFGYIIVHNEEECGEKVKYNYSVKGALQVFVSEVDANYCAVAVLGLVDYEIVKVDINIVG